MVFGRINKYAVKCKQHYVADNLYIKMSLTLIFPWFHVLLFIFIAILHKSIHSYSKYNLFDSFMCINIKLKHIFLSCLKAATVYRCCFYIFSRYCIHVLRKRVETPQTIDLLHGLVSAKTSHFICI